MPYKDSEQDKAYHVAYREAHRDTMRIYPAKYREAHREKLREMARIAGPAYTASHKEQIRAYCKAHQKEKAEYNRRYAAIHKEELRAYQVAYRKTERGRELTREHVKRRDHLKRQIAQIDPEAVLTYPQWTHILRLSKGRCYWCSGKTKRFEQDHVIPLSRGGLHTASNVVASCATCNRKKSNKVLTLL